MSRSSRDSSELEVEPHKLRSLLDSIAIQLEIPFLERRGRNKQHKHDPIEELREVIQETSERERELQACIGIARVLIDNNEKSILKINKQREEKEKDQEKIKDLRNTIETLKEELVLAEEKYDQVNKALVSCEEQLLVLNAEHKRLLMESNKLRELPDSLVQSVKDYQSEIEELKSSFRSELDEMNKNKFELERRNKRLLEEKTQMDTIYNETYEKFKTLEISNQKSQERLKALEQECQNAKFEKEIADKKIGLLSKNTEKLKAKIDKLEEDLKLTENSRSKSQTPKKLKHSRHHSLLTEIESVRSDEKEKKLKLPEIREEEEMVITSIASKAFLSFTPHGKSGHKVFSFDRSQKTLDIDIDLGIIHIESKKAKDFPGRKDPAEEYFFLATQAVKMNSSYMDAICIIPPQNLYEKAMKEDVPFHKWHIWIESQLNSAYIQMLYKKDSKIAPIPTINRITRR
ncbi:unnamed protein product [Blepharisma stoltei]|uniref:Chromosome partition protein Smc n=1 Tax=Blepharisma stoltei TaxID=1481888 RepID=A0AAU9K5X3_9CILI|nr:unnamed protein product [Blepharisma stoltei]